MNGHEHSGWHRWLNGWRAWCCPHVWVELRAPAPMVDAEAAAEAELRRCWNARLDEINLHPLNWSAA